MLVDIVHAGMSVPCVHCKISQDCAEDEGHIRLSAVLCCASASVLMQSQV
jgi:hypothetical protein